MGYTVIYLYIVGAAITYTAALKTEPDNKAAALLLCLAWPFIPAISVVVGVRRFFGKV